MSIGSEQVKRILLEIGKVIEENKEYLTELDAAIGDGDHGINMSKGFKVAEGKLNALESDKAGDMVKTVAMALISNVGGASGPLYGTMFLKASDVIKEKTEVGLQDLHDMLQKGLEGVKMRGRSQRGEKTMIDVLEPVLESVGRSIQGGASPESALSDALAAAKEGVEYTKTIKATKGRASYLGERSIGHIDPGAMSSCLMINVIHDSVAASQ